MEVLHRCSALQSSFSLICHCRSSVAPILFVPALSLLLYIATSLKDILSKSLISLQTHTENHTACIFLLINSVIGGIFLMSKISNAENARAHSEDKKDEEKGVLSIRSDSEDYDINETKPTICHCQVMEPTSVNHGPSANVENVIRGSDEEQVLNRNDDGDHHGEEVIRGYGCQNLRKTPVAALMEEVQCMKDEPKHAGDLTQERNVSSTSEVANTVARRKNKNRTTGRLSESPDATLTSENARKYPICTEVECTGTELSCSSYPLPSIDGNGRLTGKFQMVRNNNPIPSSSLTEERRAPILTLQSEVNSSRCSHATYEGNTDNVLPMEEVWDEITAKKNAGNAMTYRAKNCQDSSDPACATEKVRDENKKRTRKKGRTMSTAKRDHSNHISCLSSFTVELNRQHPPQKNRTPLRRCDHGARHNSEARCEAPLEKRSSVNAAELQELNRRFEEFIARVNNEIRLQRLQSLAAREHSFPDTCADQHEKPNMGELPLHCLMAS